ncbi:MULTISPECIES: hypothetical protein [Spongiibacter]|uniref:hypothetical protein n=1 Tax=Spongiibacter TaxID=630749 RepID=UPI001B064003|nr:MULTISPECIES: hypothetical protein [Spongiibacter]MBO6752609.1 hypothetical protein [Spongiibacter sp.]
MTVQKAGSSSDAMWPRWLLAGPLCFLCAFVMMAGASIWLPEGPARIDNVAIPLVLFPAVWGVLFFYSCLGRLGRTYLVVGALTVAHLILIVWQLMLRGAA